jgi:hypothetical protein
MNFDFGATCRNLYNSLEITDVCNLDDTTDCIITSMPSDQKHGNGKMTLQQGLLNAVSVVGVGLGIHFLSDLYMQIYGISKGEYPQLYFSGNHWKNGDESHFSRLNTNNSIKFERVRHLTMIQYATVDGTVMNTIKPHLIYTGKDSILLFSNNIKDPIFLPDGTYTFDLHTEMHVDLFIRNRTINYRFVKEKSNIVFQNANANAHSHAARALNAAMSRPSIVSLLRESESVVNVDEDEPTEIPITLSPIEMGATKAEVTVKSSIQTMRSLTRIRRSRK